MAVELIAGCWYSTEEVAQLLGVDASSVRRWLGATLAHLPAAAGATVRAAVLAADPLQRG
jgi:DNA-directed RNA polymerase specialized sigma24 family protein